MNLFWGGTEVVPKEGTMIKNIATCYPQTTWERRRWSTSLHKTWKVDG